MNRNFVPPMDFNTLTFNQRCQLVEHLASSFRFVSYYESNGYADKYGRFDWIIAAGNEALVFEVTARSTSWSALQIALEKEFKAPIKPCFLSFDLKNVTEDLHSSNPDGTDFPAMCLWEPHVVFAKQRDGKLIEFGQLAISIDHLSGEDPQFEVTTSVDFNTLTSRDSYLKGFDKLMSHIKRGDIYEVNYCRREESVVPRLNPIGLFARLNKQSPAPFAGIHKIDQSWLICSSPERFLCKQADQLISQPIKGTIRRTAQPEVDALSVEKLRTDPKELAENKMIVDLVRNDLSHFAKSGSVQVKELCEIYPFARVFQMISTVACELRSQEFTIPALAKAFPMGSMTGVPKIRALGLIEETEDFKRGMYSGSCGFFSAEGDFDLNVVIRSLTWNAKTGLLTFATGSAITVSANGPSEFEECLLKAEALKACFAHDPA